VSCTKIRILGCKELVGGLGGTERDADGCRGLCTVFMCQFGWLSLLTITVEWAAVCLQLVILQALMHHLITVMRSSSGCL
jgi:hypothetical protein